ncbi:MAG: penicillin-binding protein [Thermoanaerobaculia bacterium]|nr:penicillin-binding protein [Thermoanaerobaculia bacterium]
MTISTRIDLESTANIAPASIPGGGEGTALDPLPADVEQSQPSTAPDRQRPDLSMRLRISRRLAARMKALRRRDALIIGAAFVPLALLLLPLLWLVFHVYFDRAGVPDLEAFIRFELPSTGVVRDAHGKVLIEVAREYRTTVSYDNIPPIVRQAILATEDKNFFTHSGVNYASLPRVIRKSSARSISEWRKGDRPFRLLLPQGGSTLTQQLVRGYFLRELTSRSDSDPRFHSGFGPPRLVAAVLGAPATNKLERKLEEVRLSLWLEREMVRRYGSRERAKRELFARYANFLYLGNGRYGYAAASEYYFGRPLAGFTSDDADKAALLAAIGKSPLEYAPGAGNERLLSRRNQVLALMVRNGHISAKLAARETAEPIRVTSLNPIKTDAPAAIEHVFDELALHGGSLFSIEDLFQGRISVESTVDARVQAIVNDALEEGLARYEKRHPRGLGMVQGSVVVLRNSDAAILAEAGGRQVYGERRTRYSDYNRVTGSLRQPGSTIKPLVYLAAFERGMGLDSEVSDAPIGVPLGRDGSVKWITNYDNEFKGTIPIRLALAESRNAAAVWITRAIGVRSVIDTAGDMGIRTPLQPYLSTALGASEVNLLELANAYRAIASGLAAKPHVINQVIGVSGQSLHAARRDRERIDSRALRSIQEGLRGVVRLPSGTAHSLASRDFPIAVMGKTGTTSDFRDALFVGSTYGPEGITVAVRIGFDDNRPLGRRETGARTALPVFREIMLRVYEENLVGKPPRFPREIEAGIDEYLAAKAALEANRAEELAFNAILVGTPISDAADRSVRQ